MSFTGIYLVSNSCRRYFSINTTERLGTTLVAVAAIFCLGMVIFCCNPSFQRYVVALSPKEMIGYGSGIFCLTVLVNNVAFSKFSHLKKPQNFQELDSLHPLDDREGFLISEEEKRLYEKKYWKRFLSPRQRYRSKKKLYSRLLTAFNERFSLQEDTQDSHRIWERVLSFQKISWKPGDPLTVSTLQKIQKAFEEAMPSQGAGVDPTCGQDREAAHLLSFLLPNRESISFKALRRKLKNAVIHQEEQLLQEFREGINNCFREALEKFHNQTIKESTFSAFVHHLVALIPYAYPEEDTHFFIPVKVREGEWELCHYKVDKQFALSPRFFSSPLPAYGLVAEGSKAPPIVAFLGSTYPTGKGFMASWLTDCNPFSTIGSWASRIVKNEMRLWLEDKEGVSVYGISLGGTLSLQALRYHRDKLAHVYAINPAGLYPWSLRGVQAEAVKVHIYRQENDFVSMMGMFPKGNQVSVYYVMQKNRRHFIHAHNQLYTAGKEVTILRSSVDYENRLKARKALTAVHWILSPVMFTLFLAFYGIYGIAYGVTFPVRRIYRACRDSASKETLPLPV